MKEKTKNSLILAGRPSADKPRHRRRQAFELKLRVAKLHVEEGMPAEVVAKEAGISVGSVYEWSKLYRLKGEAGLMPRGGAKERAGKLPEAVVDRITAMKRSNPDYGVKRISQILRRIFFFKASPETVRKTLHREQLIQPVRRKSKKNPQKPRFFERSTPNQLWQSDIFCFRLGGENAYLIGFIDDYSRYITGLGVYRGQTAENVLEVYRQARGEYGVPREMLTDNGRQYTNWRGKTKFELEMQRDRIHHFRSQPHHPMTLGKIERFWKTIWEEFLERAKFDSFESAQQRIAYWVKYYNHKRPHQGIDGECPADRFFKIRKEMKAAIDRGVEENVQELAIRGEPKSQFYMVGRMGEKSVVIHAERGQVKMQVEGEEETVLGGLGNDNTGKDNNTGAQTTGEGLRGEREGAGNTERMERAEEALGSEQGDGNQLGNPEHVGEAGGNRHPEVAGSGGAGTEGATRALPGEQAGAIACGAGEERRTDRSEGGVNEQVQREGKEPGSAGGMDGEAEGKGHMPGAFDQFRVAVPLAGNSHGGYVAGVGAEMAGRKPVSGDTAETQEAAGPDGNGSGGATAAAGKAAGKTTGGADGSACIGGALDGRKGSLSVDGKDDSGSGREPHGIGGGFPAGCEPEDVLQASGGTAFRDARQTDGAEERPATGGAGQEERDLVESRG
jgi:transposase InsO family protein